MADRAERARLVARPWRIFFIVFALLVTTGTHWPQLVLPPASPATDKTIHALAFGLLALLLWQTAWVRHRGWLLLIMLAWAIGDEVSQGIPILRRHVTWQDGLANALGVVMVMAWVWALAPLGGPANRLRLAGQRFITQETFASWRTWAVLGGALLACAAPLALLWTWLRPTGTTIPVAIATAAWIGVSAMAWLNLRRVTLRRLLGRRPCLACGMATRGVRFDATGEGTCRGCGAEIFRGMWSQPNPPPLALQVHHSSAYLLTGVLIVGAGLLALIFVVPWVYATLIGAGIGTSTLPRIARTIGTMPPSLTRLVDATLLLGLFAILARLYRRRLARFYDQAWTCVGCGHDLRGTPTTQGIGRCGECGRRFVRIERMEGAHHGVTEGTEGGQNV